MAKHITPIIGLLLVGLSGVGGDQLIRWSVESAARPAQAMPGPLSSPTQPGRGAVALLGPAMAGGAAHRLDRGGPDSARLEHLADQQ